MNFYNVAGNGDPIISSRREVDQSLRSRKHAESGRTSGPLCMQITKQDTMGVRRSLSVELVVDVALDNQKRWQRNT